MAVKIKKDQAVWAISLTPMIDVVFLLLIFFLVASRFAQEDREMDITLPSASEAKPLVAQPLPLTVNIDEQGKYFVDGRLIGAEEVLDVLERAVANNPVNQSIIIRADKRVELDYVVHVLNACNRAGILDHKLTTAAD